MAKLKRVIPPAMYTLGIDDDERCLLLAALRYRLSKVALSQPKMDDINNLISAISTEA